MHTSTCNRNKLNPNREENKGKCRYDDKICGGLITKYSCGLGSNYYCFAHWEQYCDERNWDPRIPECKQMSGINKSIQKKRFYVRKSVFKKPTLTIKIPNESREIVAQVKKPESYFSSDEESESDFDFDMTYFSGDTTKDLDYDPDDDLFLLD